MADKKLFRSREDKILAGVCGGIGDFFNLDPTIIRVLWVLISVFTGGFPGLLVYIILSFIIPLRPDFIDI